MGDYSIANGATTKLRIEAMQTVIPMKPTEPRQTRRVTMVPPLENSAGPGRVFRRRFHMMFCYNKASNNDSGWKVAGWIKESLGRALVEEPLLAGRLRRVGRGENGHFGVGGDNDLEIVSNDCGVRLLEAQIDVSLDDFLYPKHDDDVYKNVVESELVFWEDIQESTPQYSPLFYIQVTNFKCGGYSIGISCSLLLADPFGMTKFLKKWSKIHNTMVSQSDLPNKIPTFYLPNLRKSGILPLLNSPTQNHPTTKTVIFKIPPTTKIPNSEENYINALAAECLEKAGDKIPKNVTNVPSRFIMFLKDSFDDVKVVERTEGFDHDQQIDGCDSMMSWGDLGADGVCLNGDNKAVYFSCWINSISDEDFVMIVPFNDEDGNVGHNVVVTTSD